MLAGYLTAVRDNRGITKALGAIVAIFDDENVQKDSQQKVIRLEGVFKIVLCLSTTLLYPSPPGPSGIDRLQICLEISGWTVKNPTHRSILIYVACLSVPWFFSPSSRFFCFLRGDLSCCDLTPYDFSQTIRALYHDLPLRTIQLIIIIVSKCGATSICQTLR